ncbi:hypothetical protein Val02_14730 [Virgisporangium aliadipatigenens]|uniref:Glyoxalase-like domain-containing protein n=1 Tax=Virgisporangium aliadipatigenens TaxID=741659 RepID=A0A8J3YHV5_9ACTN|nr:VOC family protein [Virgisporangium aliadipatigenens]GIJ44587.1 hypothetical protein Val02_14730 [Virgisporangium aliadipatigenens]
MTLASFKDLIVKAGDALALAAFWGRILGAESTDLGDASARLDADGFRVWVDPVPEPHPGQTRVHLDLRLPTADPAALVAAGAQVRREPGGDIGWWVLADPEGSEFCAFPPREGYASGVDELVTASADPVPLAHWWAGILGGTVREQPYGADLTGAAGFPWRTWCFDRVADPRVAPNRWHWDVTLTGGATVAAVQAAGARLIRPRGGDLHWSVFKDPDGNDFCVFEAPEASPPTTA